MYIARGSRASDNLGTPGFSLLARSGYGAWHAGGRYSAVAHGNDGTPSLVPAPEPSPGFAYVGLRLGSTNEAEVEAAQLVQANCGAWLRLDAAELAYMANQTDADAGDGLPRIVDRRTDREAGYLCADCFDKVEVPDPDAPPTEDELEYYAGSGRWVRVASPSGRFRVVFGARAGGRPRWWLLEGTTVVTSHQEKLRGADVADSGDHLTVRPLSGTKHEICVFSTSGECRLRATLEDQPVAFAFEPGENTSVIVQLSWVPIKGTRPDLERRVYAWLAGPTLTTWTAQTRFMADKITIRRGQVSLRSYRYGTTVLRLADGFLISDKLVKGVDSWARNPSYPGTVGAALDGTVAPAPKQRRDEERASDEGRPYASEVCPSCQVRLSPLPKSKKRCPACGQPIYVRSGPDGRRHLLKENQLAEHRAWWASVYAQSSE